LKELKKREVVPITVMQTSAPITDREPAQLFPMGVLFSMNFVEDEWTRPLVHFAEPKSKKFVFMLLVFALLDTVLLCCVLVQIWSMFECATEPTVGTFVRCFTAIGTQIVVGSVVNANLVKMLLEQVEGVLDGSLIEQLQSKFQSKLALKKTRSRQITCCVCGSIQVRLYRANPASFYCCEKHRHLDGQYKDARGCPEESSGQKQSTSIFGEERSGVSVYSSPLLYKLRLKPNIKADTAELPLRFDSRIDKYVIDSSTAVDSFEHAGTPFHDGDVVEKINSCSLERWLAAGPNEPVHTDWGGLEEIEASIVVRRKIFGKAEDEASPIAPKKAKSAFSRVLGRSAIEKPRKLVIAVCRGIGELQGKKALEARRWAAITELTRELQRTIKNSKEEFRKIDTDGSGDLDKKEFAAGLKNLGGKPFIRQHRVSVFIFLPVIFPDEKLELVWPVLDEDGNGKIDLKELLALVSTTKMAWKNTLSKLPEEENSQFVVKLTDQEFSARALWGQICGPSSSSASGLDLPSKLPRAVTTVWMNPIFEHSSSVSHGTAEAAAGVQCASSSGLDLPSKLSRAGSAPTELDTSNIFTRLNLEKLFASQDPDGQSRMRRAFTKTARKTTGIFKQFTNRTRSVAASGARMASALLSGQSEDQTAREKDFEMPREKDVTTVWMNPIFEHSSSVSHGAAEAAAGGIV
jgi:Ca2+-binding EF-hand superfamily protein